MVGSDTVSSKPRALKGRDLITIGIFTALYFVVNFACMLVSGLHPYLWVFMPALDALLAGHPVHARPARRFPSPAPCSSWAWCPPSSTSSPACSRRSSWGRCSASCLVAEVVQRGDESTAASLGNALAYAVFGFGMCGSPLPVWAFHDSFMAQIAVSGDGCRLSGNARELRRTPEMIDRDVRHDFRLRDLRAPTLRGACSGNTS